MKPGTYIRNLLYDGKFPSCLNISYQYGYGDRVLTQLKRHEQGCWLLLVYSTLLFLVGTIWLWIENGTADIVAGVVFMSLGLISFYIGLRHDPPKDVVDFEKDLKDVIVALAEWKPARDARWMDYSEAQQHARQCIIWYAHTVLKYEHENGRGHNVPEEWKVKMARAFDLFKKYGLIAESENYKDSYAVASDWLKKELKEAAVT